MASDLTSLAEMRFRYKSFYKNYLHKLFAETGYRNCASFSECVNHCFYYYFLDWHFPHQTVYS